MKFLPLIFSLLLSALHAQTSKPADYIFFGGDILTMDKENPSPETVAVTDGKIVFIGEKKKALFLQSDKTQWINIQKGALLPGFIAVSTDLLMNGLTKFTLDLSAEHIKTFSQVEDLLTEAAKHGPVLAMGYNPSLLSKKHKLGFKKLGKISESQPILVINKSGTMAYGNQKAFKLAGIDANLDGGSSLLFQKNQKGNLTGVALTPQATMILIKPFETLLKLDFKKILQRAMVDFAKKGYTTVADHGFANPLISLSSYLKSIEELSMSSLPLKIKGFGPFDHLDKLFELRKKNSSFFEVLGIYIYFDGSLQNQQALLKERYKNKNTKGFTFISKFDLNEQIIASRKKDFLVKVKASGDDAIEKTLSSFEKAQIHHFSAKHPFIIDQASLCSLSQLKMMIESHVCPSFAYQDIYLWGDVLQDKILGSKRITSLDNAKSSFNLDIPTSLQESGAIGLVDPFLCLQTFVTRQSKEKTVINQDQKISLDHALKGLTIDSSIQLNLEERIGSIEIGKQADFVILNKNPKRVPITQFPTIKVIETWVDGKKVTLFE